MSNFLINTDKKLKKIITELQSSKHLGVDTEFIRESTYYPILALLQISTKKSIFCIDVLGIKDKAMLKKILLNKKILKIMHSSKQDLEVLNRYFKSYPIKRTWQKIYFFFIRKKKYWKFKKIYFKKKKIFYCK